MSLKKAVKKDGTLREEMVRWESNGSMSLWWLGQSGFLIRSGAGTLLFDPYLSDSLTEKYAGTNKPHIRMTERAMDPALLDFVDVVTSTHNHTDHLDAETLRPILSANRQAKLVIPEANRDFVAERIGCAPSFPVGLDAGESAQVGGFRIHGIPAAHNEVDKDGEGRCKYLGYVAVFESQGSLFTVYHSGDTLWHDSLLAALEPFDIDIALLPINGWRPERGVAGNLWGNEAAELAKKLRAGLVVPCHYDMFEFNTESPDLFVETCEKLNQPYRVLQTGEMVVYPEW
jgi:L-ascorbate metabolism protein UlaG (beta-lactamase superfamily)